MGVADVVHRHIAPPLCEGFAVKVDFCARPRPGATRRTARLLGLSVSALLCAIQPVQAQEAEANAAPSADTAPAPSAAAPVYGPTLPQPKVSESVFTLNWEQHPSSVPPALIEALGLVGSNYPSVQVAKSGLSAAAADIRSAKWQRYPSLSVETNLTDGTNRLVPSVAVSAPIWAGGRISGGISRANAQFDANVARFREVVIALAIDTSQTYFDIARLARRRALLEESLAEHGRLVQSMERRVAQEVSPAADLELARSRYAQIEQELTTVQAQQQASLFTFAQLVAEPGYEIGNVPVYSDGLTIDGRDTLVDEALNYDPTLRRIAAEARGGRAELSIAKASILPQLIAQYSYNDIVGSRVGVVARLDTSGGLSRFSAVDGARARLEGILGQANLAERQLRQRVHNDLTEFDAAQARAKVSLSATQTSNRVSESYVRQFIAGRRTWLDVMNSLRETLTARLGLADAEISAMSAYVRISLRTGRWNPFSDGLK